MTDGTKLDIIFSGSTLDRADIHRRDAAWIQERLANDATRILPVWRLSPLIREDDPKLAWATPSLLESQSPGTEPVLLGLDDDDVAHFAIDLTSTDDPLDEMGWKGVAHFPDLRAVAASLPAADAAIAAQARQIVDWHARHRFCAVCGEATRPFDGGYVRRCADCSAEHFPRTDPVVIMLAIREGRCLLGRQPTWPSPFFSALAGFVEPGESIEEAVRREVQEEAGIRIGRVRYVASQPWPFPSSLMIGCLAEGLSEEVTLGDAELAEARWFDMEQVRAAFGGDSSELGVPPPMAIAHQLLRAWVDGASID